MLINFNEPTFIGSELDYIRKAVMVNKKMCGDGEYTKLCSAWLEEKTQSGRVMLTTSCTHALEMAALLCGIKEGDEVIMPSYTFCSTADAFVLRGAKIVFVDIRPDTLNINENLIEDAITSKTKAIVPVHYAGVGCEMDKIMEIAEKHNLRVIEDAAQGIMSTYKYKALGTFGDFGCISFHETKNFNMGEGGALIIRDENFIEKAEIIREKGTDRSKFYRGQVDKYSWIDAGSSYLPSDINAAYLWAQLEDADRINNERIAKWDLYYEILSNSDFSDRIELPFVPKYVEHNAHMFYIKVKNLEERTKLLSYLKNHGIYAVFHYVPLHSSPAGKKYGRFSGEDVYTTRESDRLIRLPLHYHLSNEDIELVCGVLSEYFKSN